MQLIETQAASHSAPFFEHERVRDRAARNSATVHIVDVDGDAELLSGWVRAAGLAACNYAGLADFAESEVREAPNCLVVDAGIAGVTDAELGDCVQRLGARCPIVVTAYDADVATAVLAMKTGAIDFVIKPFRESDILQAIDTAIKVDSERRHLAARRADVAARFATLSPRERQVMALVTTGRLNKQVAGDMGLSEVTVKAHRGAAVRKMGARSLAELVRMADALAQLASMDAG